MRSGTRRSMHPLLTLVGLSMSQKERIASGLAIKLRSGEPVSNCMVLERLLHVLSPMGFQAALSMIMKGQILILIPDQILKFRALRLMSISRLDSALYQWDQHEVFLYMITLLSTVKVFGQCCLVVLGERLVQKQRKIFSIVRSTNLRFNNNTVASSTNGTHESFLCVNCRDYQIKDNYFFNLTEGPAAFAIYGYSKNGVISGNRVASSSIKAFYSSDVDSFLFTNNILSYADGAFPGAHIQIINTTHAQFIDNTLNGSSDGISGAGGFTIYDYSVPLDGHNFAYHPTTTDITIKNNKINKAYNAITMSTVSGTDKHYEKHNIIIDDNKCTDVLFSCVQINLSGNTTNVSKIFITNNKDFGSSEVFDQGAITIRGSATNTAMLSDFEVSGNYVTRSTAGGNSSGIYIDGVSNGRVFNNFTENTGKGAYADIEMSATSTSGVFVSKISTSTQSITSGNFLVAGSSTLYNLTSLNSTSTKATTTYLTVTGAASTSQLTVSNGFFQTSFADCSQESQTVLYTAATGKFSCGTDLSGAGGGSSDFNYIQANNGDYLTPTSTAVGLLTVGSSTISNLISLNSTTTQATTTYLSVGTLASTSALRVSNLTTLGRQVDYPQSSTTTLPSAVNALSFASSLTGTPVLSLDGANTRVCINCTNISAQTKTFEIQNVSSAGETFSIDTLGNVVLNNAAGNGQTGGGTFQQYGKTITDTLTDIYTAALDRGAGSGGAGLGLGFLYRLENSGGSRSDIGRYKYEWVSPTAGSEVAKFTIQNKSNGTLLDTFVINGNKVGIGTTTPAWNLQIASSTSAFLTLSATSSSANQKHWTLSSQGGNFYLATSSDAYATSSVAALAISTSGSSTFANGIRLTSGCYQDSTGACITGTGGAGTVTQVATDATLTGGPITGSGTLGLNLANANTWTALQTYSSGILSSASSTLYNLTMLKSTTTNATTTNLAVTGATDLRNSTVTQHVYPAFSYSTTTWAGTTTIPLGPAYTAETYNSVKCFTDTGTLNVSSV